MVGNLFQVIQLIWAVNPDLSGTKDHALQAFVPSLTYMYGALIPDTRRMLKPHLFLKEGKKERKAHTYLLRGPVSGSVLGLG